jgi:hypothetical protein
MKKYRVTVVSEVEYTLEAENEDADFWDMISDHNYLSVKYWDEHITDIEEVEDA